MVFSACVGRLVRHDLRRRARVAALALLALACVTRPAVAQTELRQVATELATKLCAEPDVQKLKGERLMIAEFENINGKGDAVPRILQEMLTTAFVKAKVLRVVERAQMEKALKELRLSLSDLVDPENRKKLGKILGATHILVGSVSEGARAVSIDARIVAVETGESIAAQDASVATAATEGTGTASNPPVGGSVSGKPETDPKQGIDLNAKGNPTSAGEWIGKKPDMGLLGGTDIRIAWREKLPRDAATSFAAGDLVGDKTQRLVVIEALVDSSDRLAVYSWDSRRWKYKGQVGGDGYFGCVSTDLGTKPYPTVVASQRAWAWSGTAYVEAPWRRWSPSLSYGGVRYISSVYTCSYESYMIMYWNYRGVDYVPTCLAFRLGDAEPESIPWLSDESGAIADFDGDGKADACAGAERLTLGAQSTLRREARLGFWDLSASRPTYRGFTEGSYGALVTAWRPSNAKYPFVVARRGRFADGARDDASPTTSTLHLIQFDGESYPEVWKSAPLDGAILDMKVCDPKGEGEPGLVVLTQTKKGAFLTKFVMAK
ncbi:MAG: FlgO family outer membrane protein [Armatimonadetes bacterium]|nr:FlgO family outer membrane protein [Armatimonadota bacterium]